MKHVVTIILMPLLALGSVQADSDSHRYKQLRIEANPMLPLNSIFNSEGQRISLPQVTRNQPAVIIAYRGSWCPYSIQRLKEIQENIRAFENLGLQVIAISPDKPSHAAAMKEKYGLSFVLLSDPEMMLGKKLGIAYTLDKKNKAQLKEDGVDIESASGFNHHQLPHPTVFICDAQNHIVFQYSNPDHTTLMSVQDILDAAEKELP